MPEPTTDDRALVLAMLDELGESCRYLKTAVAAARARADERERLTYVARVSGLPLAGAFLPNGTPARRLLGRLAHHALSIADRLDEDYRRWAVWYARSAAELLRAESEGQALDPMTFDRVDWSTPPRERERETPAPPALPEIRLGVARLDDEIAEAADAVGGSLLAGVEAEYIERSSEDDARQRAVDAGEERYTWSGYLPEHLIDTVDALHKTEAEVWDRLVTYGDMVARALHTVPELRKVAQEAGNA